MQATNVTAAKVYTCCAFSPCADKSFDLIAGGSNGIVYLWRTGVLAASAQVTPLALSCIYLPMTVAHGSAGSIRSGQHTLSIHLITPVDNTPSNCLVTTITNPPSQCFLPSSLTNPSQAIKGGVLCLAVQGERLFCGGAKGATH